MKNNLRVKSLDIASGFCLLIMILGHAICMFPTNISLRWIIDYFWFFLPFFFFRTGYMFKHRELTNCIKLETKRLLLPYLSFTIIGVVLSAMFTPPHLYDIIHDIYRMGACSANLPLWFLPVLFCVKILLQVLHNIGKAYWIFGLLLCVLCVLNQYEYYRELPTYCRNIAIGLLTAYVGYQSRIFINKKYVLPLSLLTYVIILYFTDVRLNLFSGVSNGAFLLGFVMNVTGCISIILVSRHLSSNSCFWILEKYGRDSMIYYCAHWFILVTIGTLLNKLGIFNPYYALCISFAGVLIICPLINKLILLSNLEWILGLRKCVN